MKALWVIVLLLGRSLSFAAAPHDGTDAPPPLKNPPAPQAWLGLQVTKPDATLTAQLPSLPPGLGFVVKSVDAKGPAKTAGLQELDLLWKLGDQMLVNEGQLAALLRLSKPGDEITLAGFRAGQPLEVTLKLGVSPMSSRPIPGDLVDAIILPGDCGGPMRVVNVADRLATYSTDEGSVVVRREGEVDKVTIRGPQESLIYQGDLPGDGNLEQVPQAWRRRVQALRRGLDHALDGRIMPNRQPRPRVVAPTPQKP